LSMKTRTMFGWSWAWAAGRHVRNTPTSATRTVVFSILKGGSPLWRRSYLNCKLMAT
jgi:hypothetical protein